MAKKSRRARVKNKASEPSQRPAVQSAKAVADTVIPSKNNNRQAAVQSSAIKPVNYEYVKSDLIMIGIIAAALILIMVVLTFIPALRT